ncbi:MAG TPA: aromatic ring-hydroxylating dioxygenase subunit alpha [Acidimicrobiia bacterium]|nr:aromatic ring-hydroxylating dioxygenase subunit alpha [Acidimicrobiia bacterium]
MTVTPGTVDLVGAGPSRHRMPARSAQRWLARPVGWFQVGWSEEFPVGEAKPLRYFGFDLVAYRGESGTLHVFDAFCPHLGAHLGHGGKVCGDDIVCPFHGWRFDGAGENVDIPYSGRVNRAKRLVPWPVAERSALVFLWHDPSGGTPAWDPPAIPVADEGWYPWWPDAVHRFDAVALYPQFILENTVDLAHIKFVHGWDTVPDMAGLEEEPARFRSRFSGTLPTRDGVEHVDIATEAFGVGVIVSRLEGLRETIQVLCTTPVDEERSDVLITVLVRRLDGDPSGERPGIVRAIVKAQTTGEWQKDAPIWLHQTYNPKAPFTGDEAPAFMALRRWSARFYADGDRALDDGDRGSGS